MITVALIDDNRLMRDGLVRLLHDVEELVVVAVLPDAETEPLRRLRPRIVLLTLAAHHADPLRVAAEVRASCPDSRIILMHVADGREQIESYVAAGVSALVSRDATLDSLIATIRAVAAGAPVVVPDDPGALYGRLTGRGHVDARGAALAGSGDALTAVRMTPRERDVVALIADGMSNQQIAEHLAIASDTVKSHVRNVMKKLMVHTRLQIAAYVHRDMRVDHDAL